MVVTVTTRWGGYTSGSNRDQDLTGLWAQNAMGNFIGACPQHSQGLAIAILLIHPTLSANLRHGAPIAPGGSRIPFFEVDLRLLGNQGGHL